MKTLLSAIALLFFIVSAKAQVPKATTKDRSNQIYITVDKEPEFPGGNDELQAYFKKEIKYPADARKNKIEGRVLLQMVFEKDGSVTNIRVMKGITPEMDKEAIRVATTMPKWEPGLMEGLPVRTLHAIPVVFSL